jgi:hypothetical protein
VRNQTERPLFYWILCLRKGLFQIYSQVKGKWPLLETEGTGSFPCICKVLSSIPSTENKREKETQKREKDKVERFD